jgi:hypothetical protein
MLDSLAHHRREQWIAGTLVIDGAPADISRLASRVTVPRSCSSAKNFNPQSGIDSFLSCADVRAGGLTAVDIGAPFAPSTFGCSDLWLGPAYGRGEVACSVRLRLCEETA